MPQQLVIFDLDGTLIDSRADLTTAVNLMRRGYGLGPLSLATVTAFVGNGVHKLTERALRDAEAKVDLKTAVDRVRAYYSTHMLEHTTLYPGTIQALQGLRTKGCTMALVTNKPQAPAETICRHLGIARFLTIILGGDACTQLKPHPDPLLQAMRSVGAAPSESWMVGDNDTDLAAGRNAGTRRCFCRYGFGKLNGETYDLAVDSLDEFVAYLDNHPDPDIPD